MRLAQSMAKAYFVLAGRPGNYGRAGSARGRGTSSLFDRALIAHQQEYGKRRGRAEKAVSHCKKRPHVAPVDALEGGPPGKKRVCVILCIDVNMTSLAQARVPLCICKKQQ